LSPKKPILRGGAGEREWGEGEGDFRGFGNAGGRGREGCEKEKVQKRKSSTEKAKRPAALKETTPSDSGVSGKGAKGENWLVRIERSNQGKPSLEEKVLPATSPSARRVASLTWSTQTYAAHATKEPTSFK